MALSDIEIAQAAKMERINKIAQKLGIPEEHLVPYGHYKTKVSLEYVDSLKDKKDGKLIQPDTRGRRQDHDHRGPRRRT
jgi:formate--tetrahydrofolate ligase